MESQGHPLDPLAGGALKQTEQKKRRHFVCSHSQCLTLHAVQKASAAATDAPRMTRQILRTNGGIWKSAIPSFVFANDLDAKIFCWWALSLHWLKRLSGEKTNTSRKRGDTQRTSCWNTADQFSCSVFPRFWICGQSEKISAREEMK